MFNRNNFPAARPQAPIGGGAAVAGRPGARAAGRQTDDQYAQAYGCGNGGTCNVPDKAPILVGLDQDTYLSQNLTAGNFLPIVNSGGAQTPGYGAVIANFAAGVLGDTILAANVPAVPVVSTRYSAVFSFTSGCSWCAEGIYFSEQFLTALQGAGAVRVVLLGVWAGNAGSPNLVGFQPMSSNQIPLEMLTDPRQNCCPLVGAPCAQANAPMIAQIGFTMPPAQALAGDVIISAAMFGQSS